MTIMLLSAMPVQAQSQRWYNMPDFFDSQEGTEYIIEMIANDMSTRKQPLKVLSTSQYLLDEENATLWTNGICLYSTNIDDEEHKILLSIVPYHDIVDDFIDVESLKIRGRTVTLSRHPSVKISVERIGSHTMLVGRNANGQPVFSMMNVDEQMRNNLRWTVLSWPYLMGNYSVSDEANAVFGPRMDFYTGNANDTDPGILNGYYIDKGMKSINILYGNGRVSRGNPRDPKWGKMPGGGGAAAIMGPMEWQLTPTVDGLQALIIRDEEFVPHMPSIGKEGETVTLTKEECPYEGLPGKWAFASVIPLTDTMLKLFPKEVLKLMRGEIYARYGDTFNDAATQRYFDAQPWYQRGSAKSIHLTDLENFNYSLIKQVESTKR